MFVFVFSLVGGPYDGTAGLAWIAGQKLAVPEQIQVGTCPGDGACNIVRCEEYSRSHTAYWDPRIEPASPVATVAYVRVGLEQIDDEHGIAEFVHGELALGRFVDDREAVGMNLEPAGGIAYG